MGEVRWWQWGLVGGLALAALTFVNFILALPRFFTADVRWWELPAVPFAAFGMGFACGVVAWALRPLPLRFGRPGAAVAGAAILNVFFLLCMLLFDRDMLAGRRPGAGLMLGLATAIGSVMGFASGRDYQRAAGWPGSEDAQQAAETVWAAGEDPEAMLAALGGAAGERKLRLFDCACCRRVWPLLADVRSRAAVEAAERFADGAAGVAELLEARDAAWEAAEERLGGDGATDDLTPEEAAAYAACYAADDPCAGGAAARAIGLSVPGERAAQARLLRDIVGPRVSRPAAPGPAWRAWDLGRVWAQARRIYEERAFHEMPALADALEAAGCTDPDILSHCRSGGEHVRGCWVVDLLLGKD